MPVLKEFVKIRTGERFISLHAHYASRISSELAHDLQAKDGDKIHFFNDRAKPNDWYLAVSKDSENGSKIKKRENSNGFVFHNTALANKIRDQFEIRDKYIKIKVGKKTMIEGKPYWPLITASLF